MAFGQVSQDLLLAFGQGPHFRSRNRFGSLFDILEKLDHAPGDLTRHGGAAPADFTNGFQEFVFGCPLEEVTGRPSHQRLKDLFTVVIDREHEDRKGGNGHSQPSHALCPQHAGQVDIH